MDGYFVNYRSGKIKRQEVAKQSLVLLETAKGIIGSPMVNQLAHLAKQVSNDPLVTARLLHNTLAPLTRDPDFQIAAQIVWNSLVSH